MTPNPNSFSSLRAIRLPRPADALVLIAAAALAVEPLHWLVRTWTAPAFDSQGWLPAAAAAALVCAAVRSGPPATASRSAKDEAIRMLALVAVVRAVGHVLGIRLIGGITLAVDVYALGRALDIGRRPFSVHPAWPAILAVLALPIERVMQRLVGLPLQRSGAELACGLLHAGFSDVRCEGVLLAVDNIPILVDLPCAGTQSLFVAWVAWALFGAARGARGAGAVWRFGVAALAAAGINGARIAFVAAAQARPAWVAGVDVTADTPHAIIGWVAQAIVVAIVWASFRSVPDCPDLTPEVSRPQERALTSAATGGAIGGVLAAAVSAVAALALVLVPPSPLDVSATFDDIHLPSTLQTENGPTAGIPTALHPAEVDAYTAHGGSAERAVYGRHTLLVVRTTSPLRHLHEPGECLASVGDEVRRLGAVDRPFPTAHYRVDRPDGSRWSVRATWVSDRGRVATSVPEVVWHWLRDPGATWTGILRTSPDGATGDAFDRSVQRAFDLPNVSPPHRTSR